MENPPIFFTNQVIYGLNFQALDFIKIIFICTKDNWGVTDGKNYLPADPVRAKRASISANRRK